MHDHPRLCLRYFRNTLLRNQTIGYSNMRLLECSIISTNASLTFSKSSSVGLANLLMLKWLRDIEHLSAKSRQPELSVTTMAWWLLISQGHARQQESTHISVFASNNLPWVCLTCFVEARKFRSWFAFVH